MAKHFIAVERNGSMVFEEQDIDDYGKLIKKTDDNVVLFTQKDKCDKYDYLIAVVCGAIGGLVDVFLVGSPGNSVLGGWTDKQVDNVVMQFSKMTGWHPKSGNEKNVKSAIGHLERKFKVNYDKSASSSAIAVGLKPRNHLMIKQRPSYGYEIISTFSRYYWFIFFNIKPVYIYINFFE